MRLGELGRSEDGLGGTNGSRMFTSSDEKSSRAGLGGGRWTIGRRGKRAGSMSTMKAMTMRHECYESGQDEYHASVCYGCRWISTHLHPSRSCLRHTRMMHTRAYYRHQVCFGDARVLDGLDDARRRTHSPIIFCASDSNYVSSGTPGTPLHALPSITIDMARVG